MKTTNNKIQATAIRQQKVAKMLLTTNKNLGPGRYLKHKNKLKKLLRIIKSNQNPGVVLMKNLTNLKNKLKFYLNKTNKKNATALHKKGSDAKNSKNKIKEILSKSFLSLKRKTRKINIRLTKHIYHYNKVKIKFKNLRNADLLPNSVKKTRGGVRYFSRSYSINKRLAKRRLRASRALIKSEMQFIRSQSLNSLNFIQRHENSLKNLSVPRIILPSKSFSLNNLNGKTLEILKNREANKNTINLAGFVNPTNHFIAPLRGNLGASINFDKIVDKKSPTLPNFKEWTNTKFNIQNIRTKAIGSTFSLSKNLEFDLGPSRSDSINNVLSDAQKSQNLIAGNTALPSANIPKASSHKGIKPAPKIIMGFYNYITYPYKKRVKSPSLLSSYTSWKSGISISSILKYTFKKFSCLISKPYFSETPNKIIIHLYYYFPIKSAMKKIRVFNDPIIKVSNKKFERLCFFLSKLFNKKVELDLTRLTRAYYDSNILVQLFNKNIDNRYKKKKIFRMIFSLFYTLSRKYNWHRKNKDKNINSPFALNGFTVKIGGRLLNQKVIPRISAITYNRGRLARGKVHFVNTSRIYNKNKRGAFSITVSTSTEIL